MLLRKELISLKKKNVAAVEKLAGRDGDNMFDVVEVGGTDLMVMDDDARTHYV